MKNKLEILRKSKNLTLEKLSSNLMQSGEKISTSTLSAYEKGKVTISQRKLRALARYFNVSVRYLTGKSNRKKRTLLDNGLEFKPYSNNIKVIREERGLTQANLAQLVGTNRDYISKYELGEKPVPVELWRSLAKALSTPDEVIDVTYMLNINGKYPVHNMKKFAKSLEDHHLNEATKEYLSKLDIAFVEKESLVFYFLLKAYQYSDKEKELEKIRANSVREFGSLINTLFEMFIDGYVNGNEISKKKFENLSIKIEDYADLNDF